jgi:hypothetical protein
MVDTRWPGEPPYDLFLLACADCGGTITAPSAKVNEMNFSAPSCVRFFPCPRHEQA